MFDAGFDAPNDFKAGAQRSVEAAALAVLVFDTGFDASTVFKAGAQLSVEAAASTVFEGCRGVVEPRHRPSKQDAENHVVTGIWRASGATACAL